MIPKAGRPSRRVLTALASAFGLAAAAGGLWAGIGTAGAAGSVPTPDHVVVAVMENHAYGQIIGSSSAPYLNSLKSGGAVLTASYAITHPSQPNYFTLFSGATQGITDDGCYTPGFSSAPNLASELAAAGKSWASYNETLPSQGSTTCSSGKYARKHVPWANFTNVPPADSLPFSAFPMGNYAALPTVSFVIPNNDDNMHDGSIPQADAWLNSQLSGYANWAVANNSLLIVTWDEDDGGPRNQIPTVIYGGHVKPGNYAEQISHYNVLSTLEQMYGLPKTGYAANAPAITDVWVG